MLSHPLTLIYFHFSSSQSLFLPPISPLSLSPYFSFIQFNYLELMWPASLLQTSLEWGGRHIGRGTLNSSLFYTRFLLFYVVLYIETWFSLYQFREYMHTCQPFLTGNTILYGWRFDPVTYITTPIVQKKHFFKIY